MLLRRFSTWTVFIGLGLLSLVIFASSATLIHASQLKSPQREAPQHYNEAKVLVKRHVYYDQNQSELGTGYCGCQWQWVGASGGRVDLKSCGYEIRAQKQRAQRTEFEHIVPASWFGQQRQCWQQGGRKNCTKNDAYFSVMEADMHNLMLVVGEVNADRSNYRFGVVNSDKKIYGQCDSKVDFKQRIFEPRDEVKGMVARVYFYMYDRYDLSMSDAQQKLFMAWHKQFPVTAWEQERDQRIASVMGHHNEFVTGKRVWALGHTNTADGVIPAAQNQNSRNQGKQNQTKQKQKAHLGPIHGNKNSKIYHISNCPSYDSMAEHNKVIFQTEQEAKKAGYRKAKNCPS